MAILWNIREIFMVSIAHEFPNYFCNESIAVLEEAQGIKTAYIYNFTCNVVLSVIPILHPSLELTRPCYKDNNDD